MNHSTSLQQAQQQQQQQAHVQQQTQSTQSGNLFSVNTTNALLARAFGILLRQMTDLLVRWPNNTSALSFANENPLGATTVHESDVFTTLQVN